MIDILLLKQSEPNLNSLNEVTNASQSYFDTISIRLDSWQASQLAIKQQHAQLTKSMLIKETDHITNITKTFRISVELVKTEQVDALEFPEMEVSSYVS